MGGDDAGVAQHRQTAAIAIGDIEQVCLGILPDLAGMAILAA
jgi:hypothetical protein